MRRATSRRAAPALTRAFLFSDLRDFTTFVETRGDAAAARLLRDYRTLVRREVARHKGAEVKTEGDSFYVVFDSASVALDCAVAILRRVKAHNEKEPERGLRVGVGLHAGETIAFDRQFVGSAVNIGSRLASQAQGGELLISDTLRGLVRTGRPYPMTDRGPLQLKGVAEPIHAWSVQVEEGAPAPTIVLPPTPAPRLAPAPGQIVCPVLIGRVAELARVETLLDAAAQGQGQTAVVAGEAGAGKTAFVRELTARAVERGFRVLVGPTMESDRGLPYAPFIAAVRSGFRGLERDRLGRVLTQTAPDLAQLFPELSRAVQPGAALEQHRLAVAFHGLVSAFAREAPILLVLEDLHWSDEASLELLHYLARELRDSRALVLATYRSDEMHRRHPFLRTLGSLQRERLATEVALPRLSAEETAALIEKTFEVKQHVSAEFRDAVFGRAEGNPFFTEELLKALVESGDIYRTETGWERKPINELKIPASIREAVHARIERLSPDAQATLAAGAVFGLRFPFEVLRASREAAAADVLAHLRQFIDLQLAVEAGGEDDAYAFRHALTREVVYDELLAPERKALHRAVANVLAARSGTEPSLLAHHLVAAGDHPRAVPHLLEAARRAMTADAPREAAAHCERALEIGVGDELLASTLEQLAAASLRFDLARCRRAAEQALVLYRKAGDRRGASRTLLLVSRVAAFHADPRAPALAEESRDVVEGLGDTVELARALIRLAFLAASRDATSELRELGERILTLGERLPDPLAVAEGHLQRGWAALEERPEEGLALILRGKDLAVAGGFAESAAAGYFRASQALARTGRPADEVIALIEEGLEYARRHGVEQTGLIPTRGYFHLSRGEWDEALASAQRIERDSDWYDNALEIRARIAEGAMGLRQPGPCTSSTPRPGDASPAVRPHLGSFRARTVPRSSATGRGRGRPRRPPETRCALASAHLPGVEPASLRDAARPVRVDRNRRVGGEPGRNEAGARAGARVPGGARLSRRRPRGMRSPDERDLRAGPAARGVRGRHGGRRGRGRGRTRGERTRVEDRPGVGRAAPESARVRREGEGDLVASGAREGEAGLRSRTSQRRRPASAFDELGRLSAA